MNYLLRRVVSADSDFLFRLKCACLKEYVEAIWGWDETEQRRRFLATFDPADSHIVVAFGRDIGQYAVEIKQEEIFLSGLYLLPAYQGRGLGSQILSNLLLEASHSGRAVRLQVLASNPARNLYERLGFRVADMTATHFVMSHEA